MLKTLSEGNTSADEIAGLARGQLRRKHDDLVLALEGRVEEHHRFLLAIQLPGSKQPSTTLRHSTLASRSGSSLTAHSLRF